MPLSIETAALLTAVKLTEFEYDLLIAGGGPAGLSAACHAARGGLKVALFERNKEIGYPIHTSGGSWIDELRALDVPDRFMHPVSRGIFVSSSARAEFTYQTPVSCILDVRGLYQFLAKRAAEAGARVFANSHVVGALFQDQATVGLRLKSGIECLAPLVIDATGFSGAIARQVGLRTPFARYGIGIEYDLVAARWPSDTVALLFGDWPGPAGYAWIFPHHDERVRVGIGLIHPDSTTNPKESLEFLYSSQLRDLLAIDYDFSNASAIEVHFGSIPAVPPLPRTSTDGLMVVGDAGGMISTLLGEGIRFAVDIGRMAGEVAVEAHRVGRCDRAFLRRFDSRWRSKYGKLFALSYLLNRRFSKYTDDDWNNRIRLLAQLPAETIPSILKGEFFDRRVMTAMWQNKKLFSSGSFAFQLAQSFFIPLTSGKTT